MHLIKFNKLHTQVSL